MAYATIEKVQELVAQLTLGSDSVPTIDQAASIMEDTASEINVRLSSAGYATPITTPVELTGWLSLLNAYGTAAAVLKSAFPDAVGPNDTPAYAFWEERYQAGLTAIGDGTISPVTPTSDASLVLPSTYFTRNPDMEEDTGRIAEPLFKMGKSF